MFKSIAHKLSAVAVTAVAASMAVAPSAQAYGGLIQNGDFELGHVAWQEYAYSNGEYTPVSNIITEGNNGGGGNYYAYIYGSTAGQDVLVGSTFTAPSANELTLTFDGLFSKVGSCTTGNNTTDIVLGDETTNEVIDTFTLHNANTMPSDSNYNSRSVTLGANANLASRAGHTMSMFFTPNSEDPNCEQVVFLDNVSLNAGIPVYRMANWMTQERLFTTSQHEVQAIKDKNGWVHEGTSFRVSTSGTPVYRMANWKTQERLFTTDMNEVQAIKDKNGWVHEGTAFHVQNSGTPVYRMANWKTQERLFTTDLNEVLTIKDKNGWVHEGTAFYVQ